MCAGCFRDHRPTSNQKGLFIENKNGGERTVTWNSYMESQLGCKWQPMQTLDLFVQETNSGAALALPIFNLLASSLRFCSFFFFLAE